MLYPSSLKCKVRAGSINRHKNKDLALLAEIAGLAVVKQIDVHYRAGPCTRPTLAYHAPNPLCTNVN